MWLLSFWSCVLASGEDVWMLSPALGQTAVPEGLPLRVVTGDAPFPPSWDGVDPIEVVDLTHGGLVAGRTRVAQTSVTFEPDEPWPVADFAWSIHLADGVPHGPEADEAWSSLEGEAFFSTEPRLDVLATPLTRPKTLCLVLSRPAAIEEMASASVRLLDGCCGAPGDLLPAVFEPLPRDAWGDPLFVDPGGDPGLDVWCHAFTAGELEPGALLEIEVDGRLFTSVADMYNVPDTLAQLRSATCEPRSACVP